MRMLKTSSLSLICCYESSCGGETRATESICQALEHTKRVYVKTIVGGPLIRTDMFGFLQWLILSVYGYAKIIQAHAPVDWIYTTTYTGSVAAWLLMPWKKHRIAFHYHGNRVPDPPRRGSHQMMQRIKYQLVLWLQQLSFGASDVVFVPSEFTKRVLSKTYRNLEHKIIIVPNGVDSRIFKPLSAPERVTLRRRMGIPPEQKVVLCVGRLQPKKGLHYLARVFSMLIKHNDACLCIVCPSASTPEMVSYKGSLQSTIQTLGVQEKVRWFTDMDNNSLMSLYNIADVFTLFSREEQMPLVILEALACGIPIVSMRAGGIAEVLGSVGMQTLPRGATETQAVDAIQRIFALPKKEKDIVSERERTYAVRHSWNTTATEIYKYLFNDPKKNR